MPPKVVYELTDYGRTLGDLLVRMSIWGEQRVAKLKADHQDVTLLNPKHDGYEMAQN